MSSTRSLDGRPSHDNVQGIAYAYNVPPAGHQPPPHMDPGMYQPPPWGPPGYGMFPFPPPGMMMPGMPPGLPPGLPPGMPSGYVGEMPGMEPQPEAQPPPLQHHTDMSGSLSPPMPPSRERFSYTRYQLEMLNCIYTEIRYPNTMQKQLIGKRVGITRDQVKIWFQNRRRKDVVGKTSVKDEYLQTNVKKMVPADVTTSVMNELMVYQNDPKGKNAKQNFSNKTFEEKTRKIVTARRRSSMLNSPSESVDSDTTSLPSTSPPLPTTVQTRDFHGLFADGYQPNNVKYNTVESNNTDNNRKQEPSYHSPAQSSFPEETTNLPMPTAGLATIQPVALSDDAKESVHRAFEESRSGCDPSNSLIDIVPDDGRRDVPTSLHTITPLTPVTTDSESNDGFSSARSSPSPAYTELSTESHQTKASENLASNIDIASPPNVVVIGHPHTIVPLKRSRCEDSESEDGDDEQVEPPRKRQERLAENEYQSPPNTVAPPSDPIKYNPVLMIAPNSALNVDIPRGEDSPSSSPGSVENHSTSALTIPQGLHPPEPLAWPPHQWGTRPSEPHYPATTHAEDSQTGQCMKDNPFMNFPPIKPITDFMSNSYYPPLAPTGMGYPWDVANSVNNNGLESDLKDNCDKSLSNHLSFMSSESSKITPYGYESSTRYAPLPGGRQELLPPWMASLPTPYSPCPPAAQPENTNKCDGS